MLLNAAVKWQLFLLNFEEKRWKVLFLVVFEPTAYVVLRSLLNLLSHHLIRKIQISNQLTPPSIFYEFSCSNSFGLGSKKRMFRSSVEQLRRLFVVVSLTTTTTTTTTTTATTFFFVSRTGLFRSCKALLIVTYFSIEKTNKHLLLFKFFSVMFRKKLLRLFRLLALPTKFTNKVLLVELLSWFRLLLCWAWILFRLGPSWALVFPWLSWV